MKTIRIGEGDAVRIANLPVAHTVKEAISHALTAYEDGEIFTPFGEAYRWGRGEVGGASGGCNLLSPRGLMMRIIPSVCVDALEHLRVAEKRLFGGLPFDALSHEQVMEALKLALTLPVREVSSKNYRRRPPPGLYTATGVGAPQWTPQGVPLEGAFAGILNGATTNGPE